MGQQHVESMRHEFALILGLLFLTSPFCLSGAFAQPTLTRHTIDSDLRAAYWVHPEDIDGDGDLDIATASFDGLSWYENDGNENFQKHFLGSAQAAWSVFAADLDTDGDIDILGGSTATKEIVWFENKGGNFTRHVLEQNWQDPESVFAADFDGDGDNDILSCAVNDDLVAWWENNGGQNFTKHIIDNLSRAHTIHAIDLNGDGNIDVIAGGSSQIRWYSNDGSGNFTKKTVAAGGAWGVSAADIDGDGDSDILRTQRDNGDVDWFENDGTGNFSEHLIQSAYGESWSVVAGDVDADGDLDVSAAGFADNTIMLWLNNGGGNFSPGIVVDSVDTPRGVDIVDLDEDGDADIIAAIREDRDVAWYEVVGTVFENITIEAPVAGDSLLAGSTFQILWTTTGAVTDVKIEFSADTGTSWSDVVATTPNDGNFNWVVPDTSSQLSLLRISDASDNDPSETSSGTFTILRESELPQSITVLAPNGGEELNVDSTFTITWTTAGVVENVGIDFSSNNGVDWTVVTASVLNDGQYNWTIPDAESDSTLIRIYDAADNSPADTSDAVFTIKRFVPPPSIALLSPNGGETLYFDSTFAITWSSTGDFPGVRIEFSDDGGQVWSDVVTAANNTGSFDWLVPNSVTSTGLIRISAGGQGVVDQSDSTFSIADLSQFLPFVSGFAPTAGPPGTEVSIVGGNLLDVVQVAFSGADADFVIVSEDSLLAVVPQTATSGSISIINSFGEGISLAEFQVRANPDTTIFKFQPTEDAQVKLTDVNKNFGSKTSFKVENNKFVSYLKFQPLGLPDQLVSAEIQLFAVAGSQSGGSLTLVSNFLRNSTTPWTEDTLRANNAPLVDGSVLSTAGTVAIGDTVRFEVLSALAGDGIYGFALTSSLADLVQYASKEAVEKPTLVVKALTFGNLTPLAIDDTIVLSEDGSASALIIANDVDPDGKIDSTSVTLLNQPTHLTVGLEGGVLTVTPKANFFGEDSLIYQVADDAGTVSNIATVHVMVRPVNDPPVAVDDSVATLMNKAVQIAILQNDIDIDGMVQASTVQFERTARPGSSSEFDASSGILTYIPPSDYSGVDTLSYIVQDDSGAVSNEGLIQIIVAQTNSAPVIQSFVPENLQFEFSSGETILFSVQTIDNDGDSLALQWQLIDPVSGNGTVVSTSNDYAMNTNELTQTSYIVRFEVSDGLLADAMEWRLDLVTSVDLSTFQARFTGFSGVEITWSTSREVDNSGFNVLRGLSLNGTFEKANQEKIEPVAKGLYKFFDKTVRVGVRYFYVLEDVDVNGNVNQHGPVSVEVTVPKSFSMAQNFPNPFNPQTKIHFELPKSGTVLLRIFDTLGREVRTLVSGRKDAGFHEIVWDARDNAGHGVASGIYFYQISYEGSRITRRMLLVR